MYVKVATGEEQRVDSFVKIGVYFNSICRRGFDLFRAKTAAYITAPGYPHANGGMSGLSGCGGSVGLNTNIMVIMEVARMLRSKVHIFQFASIILYTGTTRSR